MEPMVPEEANHELEDLAYDLVAEANRLGPRIHPIVRSSVGELVRSMNCYYSNLIENHDTHPREIDRALANDFSEDPKRRELQQEALAHIYIQRLIDEDEGPDVWPASATYAMWIHEEFCKRLPPEMLWVTLRSTGQRIPVVPGALREHDVEVGNHLPPAHSDVPRFMVRFDKAYQAPTLSKMRRVQTVGAVHHRFLWIHPFLDGNGRVARLMSHALFKQLGVGTSLWSVARGLARNVEEYKSMLRAADGDREGDRDGRGNLTQRGLIAFCRFFLETALDQVRFMGELLDTDTLLTRMAIHIEEEVRLKRLPRGSFPVLREAVLMGEVERAQIPALTGYEERAARNITSALVDRGMLTSKTQRAPLRLAFSADIAERWFPNLYPANAGRDS